MPVNKSQRINKQPALQAQLRDIYWVMGTPAVWFWTSPREDGLVPAVRGFSWFSLSRAGNLRVWCRPVELIHFFVHKRQCPGPHCHIWEGPQSPPEDREGEGLSLLSSWSCPLSHPAISRPLSEKATLQDLHVRDKCARQVYGPPGCQALTWILPPLHFPQGAAPLCPQVSTLSLSRCWGLLAPGSCENREAGGKADIHQGGGV